METGASPGVRLARSKFAGDSGSSASMLIVLQFVRDIAVLEIPYPCTFYFSLLLSFSSTLNSFLFEPFFFFAHRRRFVSWTQLIKLTSRPFFLL